MKKLIAIVVVMAIAFSLISCGAPAKTQLSEVNDHLDLGQKYLLDGEYEKAIVEFNKAIEIDPKNVDAYLGLADAYTQLGDYDSAIAVLERGYAEINSAELTNRISELRGIIASSTVVPEVTTAPETTTTQETTTLAETTITPETTMPTGETVYYDDGSFSICEYDDNGELIRRFGYNSEGLITYIQEWVRYEDKSVTRTTTNYNEEGSIDRIAVGEWDSNGNLVRGTRYFPDGSLYGYRISEYYSDGTEKRTWYNADDTIYRIWDIDASAHYRVTYENLDDCPEDEVWYYYW